MISIIIPTLNEEKAIEKTLRSLSAYKGNREIILSDSESTDKTTAVAEPFVDKIVVSPRRLYRTIAAGRNVGAAAATGDFLVFCDADTWLPDADAFFEKARSLFLKDDNLVALTVALRVIPEKETIPDRIVFSCLNAVHFFLNDVFHWGASAGEFQMIRADAFREVGGYDEKLVASEDYDMFRRLSRIGRTHFEGSLTFYHSGRHAHSVGWPRLLWKWWVNFIEVLFFKKSSSEKWEEVR
jgi:glycosyltransferase involved in cell wall biosynthesis